MGRILDTLSLSQPRVHFVCVGCGTPLGEPLPDRLFTPKDVGPSGILYRECRVCQTKRIHSMYPVAQFKFTKPDDDSCFPDA